MIKFSSVFLKKVSCGYTVQLQAMSLWVFLLVAKWNRFRGIQELFNILRKHHMRYSKNRLSMFFQVVLTTSSSEHCAHLRMDIGKTHLIPWKVV
jgi:hypothetical protein